MFDLINWNAPWLQLYRPVGERIAHAIASKQAVHEAFNTWLADNPSHACPVRFTSQTEAMGAAAYESFIFKHKTVPTRDNLHDFFNALVWLHFPSIKSRLNALQAIAIANQDKNTPRGKLRDALTLFDENAAFLIEHNPKYPLLQAIRNKAWQDAFVEQRVEWAFAEAIIFGHALLEKLVTPRKAMTAHVLCPLAQIDASKRIDTQIAMQLSADHLATKPYAPLPVMGVPGWCAENEDAGFYEDASVFRTPKF
jgi:Protein of unknown function (DUF3025)